MEKIWFRSFPTLLLVHSMGTAVKNSSNDGSQVHLIIAVDSWMPFAKVEVDPYDKRVNFAEGCMKPFLDVLVTTAQASYELVVPADHEWGAKRDNGSWSGMIGLLVDKKADMAVGPFIHTYIRNQAVDFGELIDVTVMKILTKYSSNGADDSNQKDILLKLKDMDWKIFYCLLMSWCLVPFTCMAIEIDFTGFHYYFDFIAAFFGHGIRMVLPKAGIRMVLVSFFLAAMVLRNHINGFLHSSIVVQRSVKLIDSFDDLHKAATSSGLCPVFEYGSAVLELFRGSSNPLLRDLMIRSESCNGFVRAPQGAHFAKRFNDENVAFVEADASSMSQGRVFCNSYPQLHLHWSSEGKFPSYLSFVMAKTFNAHLKRIFSRKVRAVFEGGIMKTWMKSTEAERGRVPCLESSTSKGEDIQEIHFSLQVFRGVFLAWGVGLAVAALVLCIEKIISCIIHMMHSTKKAMKRNSIVKRRAKQIIN